MTKFVEEIDSIHNKHPHPQTHTFIMSSDETCPLRPLQEAIEHLAGVDNLPESVYLNACNTLKDLHPLTKLYKVTYLKFYVESYGPTTEVARRTSTIIMERKDDSYEQLVTNWHAVFERGSLPHDMSSLPIGEPFNMDGAQVIVKSVEPYLKRGRDGEPAEVIGGAP